jgi:uncharacterized membrane protein
VGVAALVLGILGIVMALVPSFGISQMIGVVVGIVALILGIISRRKAKDEGERTGAATAGIVLGIIALVLSALLFAACKYCQHKVAEGIKNPEFQRQFRKGFQRGLKRGIDRERLLRERREALKKKAAGSEADKP